MLDRDYPLPSTMSTGATVPKYSFMDDYSEGAHPRILQALSETNGVQQVSYGDDEYCATAKQYLRRHMGNRETAIFFVPSGTSANLICIASCLRPFEAVIATSSAHIVTQEAGAIAALGHHIITVEPVNGKMTAASVAQAVKQNSHPPHTVLPRLVYVSNASETGTAYSKEELAALADTCKTLGLLLFMDGARLGTALCSPKSHMTLADIFDLTDIFWLGGTKNGALFGEAIVVKDEAQASTFAYHIKQRGALLAKSRTLGIQFSELFRDGLFWDLATNANRMAQRLAGILAKLEYHVNADVETNQMFVVVPSAIMQRWQERFLFHVWEELDDDRVVVRLVTSWATNAAQVDAFGEFAEGLARL
ncbi:Aromatic amino acid beta-eliminating lyase/threonine aldolase [Penicillium hispanicum]|uniref:Aromatic amino acid beta-eliminating lyase/threonine aldolase n=1 Tax=Penicillium hispanicum TaxID=1080232 RepID=UPI002540AE73|nr:Aromatic amino acid beta-eliminating lyase/threonine aldolase [Penicillium hispanicum]KAJ5595315.1 Aromatic amino acid beta-eliminating lyase/threonine aldolase [Penicillium hispanicum]